MQVWKQFKDLNIPMNNPQIVLDHWSKKIEEYFHLRKPDNINLSNKYTTQDVKILIDVMVKHVNFMEQVIIGIQENIIESENESLKQSICIY